MDAGPPAGPQDYLQMAVEKGADVATLERLMVVRRELREEAAKTAFDDAMALFQAKCPVIVKSKDVMNKDGRSVRYRFAPLDVIVSRVRPILQECGFSYQMDSTVEDKWVLASCKVTHRFGHSITSTFKVPIDKDAFMSDQQKFAAALTYAKRYAFVNAFGILTGDQDTDATDAEKTRQSEAAEAQRLKAELWTILKDKRGPEKNWKQAQAWLWDECCCDPTETVQAMDAARLAQVIERAKEKLLA